ncbi:hypothetical protein [Spirillospora sp. NPDC047279]|uniref:GlsB/YeaQ/YmgE family stress response membrane protein n=1 Tax=Spirillospora sp. NPDC047279 TaxID=3155478 RepID=UPI0033D0F248
MLTTILWFIVVGAIIGVIARLLVPGKNPIGVLMTILVGIAGAILGGVVAESLNTGRLVALVFALIIAAAGVAAMTAMQRKSTGRGRSGGRSRSRWGSRRRSYR